MSRSLRRLMKESTELSTTPSPHFHAAPVSDSNLYDWHFTLAGPPAPSPYSGGIYHGRITFPPTYPLRPPSFRFLTPSGRFEVNREICLSISGHHEETWQPAWGVRTALLAIRSFMGMPGEGRGQVGGLEVSDEVRREWAGKSRSWCCEGCEGSRGRSNEVVLQEWRGYCVGKGVDVEKEDEGEDVPEELRIGVKKEKSTEAGGIDGVKNDAEMAAAATGDANATKNDQTNAPTLDPSMSVPSGTPGVKRTVPTSTPAPPTALAPIPTRTTPRMPQSPRTQARIHQQQRVLQNPALGLHTPRAAPAPVASQDSPWLDRAIFGVLIALVLMILRRVIDLED